MLEFLPENQYLLLLLLGVIIFIAFKVMQVVLGTVMAAALSGGTYIAFEHFIRNSSPSIETMLISAAAGAVLYMVYVLATSTYSTAAKILYLPKKIAGLIYRITRSDDKKEDEE